MIGKSGNRSFQSVGLTCGICGRDAGCVVIRSKTVGVNAEWTHFQENGETTVHSDGPASNSSSLETLPPPQTAVNPLRV